MAGLKWNNVVGAKGGNAGAASLKEAGSLFSKAFENFSGAVEGRQKREVKDNTTGVANQIRNIGTRAELDAATNQFGDFSAVGEQFNGNIDTAALSKELFAKRGYIDQQEADALSQSNAAYNLNKSRVADQRTEATYQRGIANEASLQKYITATNEQESTNANAFGQALTNRQNTAEGPVQIQQDNGGNILPNGASLESQQAFSKESQALGAKPYLNVAEQITEFNKSLPKNTTRAERKLMEEAIRANYDSSKFSKKEQASNADADKAINDNLAIDIQAADEVTSAAVAAIPNEPALGPRERAKAQTKFIKDVRTMIPNKTIFGFTGTDDQGGTTVTKKLSKNLAVGGKWANLEPWEVEQFMISTVDGENGAWTSYDTYTDLADWEAQVDNYVQERGASPVDRQALKQAAILARNRVNKATLRAEAEGSILKQTALRNRAKGTINRNKNYNAFNPVAPTSEDQLKSVAKAKPQPPKPKPSNLVTGRTDVKPLSKQAKANQVFNLAADKSLSKKSIARKKAVESGKINGIDLLKGNLMDVMTQVRKSYKIPAGLTASEASTAARNNRFMIMKLAREARTAVKNRDEIKSLQKRLGIIASLQSTSKSTLELKRKLEDQIKKLK